MSSNKPLRGAEEENWKVCHIIPDFPASSLGKLGTGPLVDQIINPKASASYNTRSTRNTKEKKILFVILCQMKFILVAFQILYLKNKVA